MLERLNAFILGLMDWLLGWLLHLPSDAALFALAIASAGLFKGVRFFTTNQDLLRRCQADRKRLKVLLKEARQSGDKETLRRLRVTTGMIALKQLKAEGKPLLAALVPIALLATWAAQRLEFHPLRAGERVQVNAYFPVSAVGNVVHLVPEESVTARDGWIREIEAMPNEKTPGGLASWTLQAAPHRHRLQFRYQGRTYTHSLRVGERRYETPLSLFDDRLLSVAVKLEPVRLFGIVPGISAFAFPPWLVAYLVLTVPLVMISKRLVKIY
ncbi:MAG: hypothetical protein HYY24_27260 [Verrucomicrobia bacterium]|nr:hypothetical protein [Verrucomicrobiota bacterium]